MNHDRGAEDSCNASGYNFGYRSPTATFRSILAYACALGQRDNMPKDGCPRVQRFFNTQFLYNGQLIGNDSNNNALQFNNLRSTIAAHFPAMNCQSNSQCNDNNVNTVDTCNVAKAVCVFTGAPVVPIAPTPVATPIVPTRVAPIAPTPVVVLIVPTPVVVPIDPTPVVVPIDPTPVVVPIDPTPVAVPTDSTPVVVPATPTPVDDPITPAPVDVPLIRHQRMFPLHRRQWP
jgi:hypothetical protein